MIHNTLTGASRSIWRCGAVATLVLATAGIARADTINLHDQNSSATINSGDGVGPIGMNDWTVDGTNRLFQQWFAFRYQDDNWSSGPDGTTHAGPLDSLGAPVINTIGDNAVSMNYNNGSIGVAVTYTLTGDAADSLKSTIQEQITVTNLMNRWLQGGDDLHFFQYSDFNLCGAGSTDSVDVSYGGATQSSTCDGVISETTINPQAGLQEWPGGGPGYEAGSAADVSSHALNGVDLNNNGSFSGGDAAWAFEWTIPLSLGGNPGDSFTITKTKSLAPVPEPMSLMLLGAGLLGLGRAARRRYSNATV